MNDQNNNQDGAQKQQSEWNDRELGALWKRESRSGSQTYLAGHVVVDELGTEKKLKVVVFSNKNKTNERAPDFRIYKSKEFVANTEGTDSSSQSTDSSNDEEIL